MAAAAVLLSCADLSQRRALWPGAGYSESDRERATQNALGYLYRSSQDKDNFERYASDYLWAFYSVADTARSPDLSRVAHEMGLHRARAWGLEHGDVPANASADDLYDLVSAADACDRLGQPNVHMREELRRAAARFTARDYLLFDPASEPPPGDVPKGCSRCGSANPRGATRCKRCGGALEMRTRYDVWTDALLVAYTGDSYQVKLGASARDVLRWVASLRPYPPPRPDTRLYSDALYAVTHVVYTLNDYGHYHLSPSLVPAEFALLEQGLREAIAQKDPETVGECLDTLRAFGLTEKDAPIQAGTDYLLSTQRPDGTWGNSQDPYTLYHAAWTGLDGLREYIWRGDGPKQELKDLLAATR